MFKQVRLTTLSKLLTLTFLGIGTAVSAPANATSQEPSLIAPDFQMKRCVNMGNALEAPSHAAWGRLYEEADYARIAQAGFDTVRIPVRWSDYLGPAPHYRIHPDFAELVDQNIEWALEHGLKVILNIHHFNDLMENPSSQIARYEAIWTQLAVRYAGLPQSVWFEVLNEPHNNLKGAEMRRLQALGLQTIRAHNPTRIVILGGEEWSGINSLGTNLSSDDPNIVYTFHYYDPFSFTHQQAQWLGDNMPKGKRGWGSRADQAELARAVEIASAFRTATNRPVFLGEFGVNSPVDNDERVKWARAVRRAMEEGDIPWCLWAYGNTFALYSDESGWDEDMLKAITGEESQP